MDGRARAGITAPENGKGFQSCPLWKTHRPQARPQPQVRPRPDAEALAALPFAYAGLSGGGGCGGNPAFRAASLLTHARLADLAPLLNTTPDVLITTLLQRGYPAQSPDDTLDALAVTSGKPALDLPLPVESKEVRRFHGFTG